MSKQFDGCSVFALYHVINQHGEPVGGQGFEGRYVRLHTTPDAARRDLDGLVDLARRSGAKLIDAWIV